MVNEKLVNGTLQAENLLFENGMVILLLWWLFRKDFKSLKQFMCLLYNNKPFEIITDALINNRLQS